jgi:NTE family protein
VPTQALVLSGGGPLAVAWESGLLAGLAKTGVRPWHADFILGTSAGAIVGAQIAAGVDPADLAAAILAEANGIRPPGATNYAAEAVARLPALFAQAHGAPGDRAAARAQVGALALAAATESEADCVARFAATLGGAAWPASGLGCVAVDAVDGSVHILTRDCGASLAHAVAASCSLPGLSPPITVGGRRYIDGGLASTANAGLMTGYDKLLVLAFRPVGPGGDRMQARLEAQIAALRAGGADLLAILPDAASQAAIGPNGMDVRRRPEIAHAAIAQGRAAAARIGAFWEVPEGARAG